jgi:hypothetical protein
LGNEYGIEAESSTHVKERKAVDLRYQQKAGKTSYKLRREDRVDGQSNARS